MSIEYIKKHLKNIDEQIESLEYYCDTEIVGDDTRHLLYDIHAAKREHLRTSNEHLSSVEDLKPLYDRLKRINASIKVMRGTLSRCEKAIAEAIESCDCISQQISESEDNDDEL